LISHGHTRDEIRFYDIDQINLFLKAIDKEDSQKIALGVQMINLAMSGDEQAISNPLG